MKFHQTWSEGPASFGKTAKSLSGAMYEFKEGRISFSVSCQLQLMNLPSTVYFVELLNILKGKRKMITEEKNTRKIHLDCAQ